MKIEEMDAVAVYNEIIFSKENIDKVTAIEQFARAAQADALRQVISQLEENDEVDISILDLQSALAEMEKIK